MGASRSYLEHVMDLFVLEAIVLDVRASGLNDAQV
jgi:hypothetical protein